MITFNGMSQVSNPDLLSKYAKLNHYIILDKLCILYCWWFNRHMFWLLFHHIISHHIPSYGVKPHEKVLKSHDSPITCPVLLEKDLHPRPLDGTQVLGSAASLIRWVILDPMGHDSGGWSWWFFNVDNEIHQKMDVIFEKRCLKKTGINILVTGGIAVLWMCLVSCVYIYTGWWFQPSWKIRKSMGRIIPYIMENKKMFQTTNQYIYIYTYVFVKAYQKHQIKVVNKQKPIFGASLEPEIHPSMNLVGSWLVWSCHVCWYLEDTFEKVSICFKWDPLKTPKTIQKRFCPPAPKDVIPRSREILVSTVKGSWSHGKWSYQD